VRPYRLGATVLENYARMLKGTGRNAQDKPVE